MHFKKFKHRLTIKQVCIQFLNIFHNQINASFYFFNYLCYIQITNEFILIFLKNNRVLLLNE